MSAGIPLVIAAHGTRIAEGQAECRRLVDRVASLLPGICVRGAYVELDTPTIPDAVASALAAHADRRAVIVPLMLGAGGHVRDDIPEGGEAGRLRVPGAEVRYSEHLGPHLALRRAVRQRAEQVMGDWTPAETGVVFLGRGCSVTTANADHTRLARVVGEEAGWGLCVPAFIQVVRPHLADGLDQVYACGFRRIVVSPNFLFPGRLHRWASGQIERWLAAHPDAEVRLADVIGDCDELAEVVVERYRRTARSFPASGKTPPYLSGLDLAGRPVLVAGAGAVATRRIPALLDAGAAVHVVAPGASGPVQEWAASGRVTWSNRRVQDADLEGVWYALAATDDPDANALVARAAEQRRIFCVRADDATGGTARTPASGVVDGLVVGVVGDRNPRRSASARDAAVEAIGAASL